MNRKKHHSIIELVEQARLQSQINQNLANELIQSIEEEKKRNNASFLLVIKTLLVICLALLIALFLILDRNNALEEDLTSNQNLVNLLEQRDSTFTRMLGMDTLLVSQLYGKRKKEYGKDGGEMGLTGYNLTRANKREKDAERSAEEMRLNSAKRSARVELQRAARNIRDMIESLPAWKRSPLYERKLFYQLLVGLFRQELTTKRTDL